MTALTRAEQVTEPLAFHGEGPVWSPSWGGLRFVDMFAGDILSLAASGAVGRRHVGAIAAALRPRRDGGAVIAVERGFVLEDSAGDLTVLPDIWADPTIRMNDGGCDPDGRFYCGTTAYDHADGRAALYRLDSDESVSLVFGAVTISNGLGWSADGATAYYVDTPTRRIDRFDYAAHTGLTGRRALVEIPEGAGFPDGLTVDADDHIWVALYDGAAVRRYRPDGTLDGVIDLPVSRPTACTFGGENLTDLFITTSRENLADGAEPEAGALFCSQPGVRGLPVIAFAG